MFDLQEIRDYLFCSLWYYLKHRPSPLVDDAGTGHPLPTYTTLDLPGMALRQALGVYASGKYSGTFMDLAGWVWEAWFLQKGVGPDVLASLKGYARVRASILEQFTSGKITGKDHQRYIEPRMSTRFKGMLETSGLTHIATSIDEAALSKLGCAPGELPGLGIYRIADAYCDTLHMASLYQPPLRETIYGLHVPARVQLASGDSLSAVADLILVGESSSIVEVHDFSPTFVLSRTWVGRRLEVISALWMESADPERPFPKVERVVYRHFMTGKTVERKALREARLIFALEAARRGIQAGIYIPQFLSGDLSRCRQCPAQEICIPASGDLTEWFLPGEAEYAQRVAKAV